MAATKMGILSGGHVSSVAACAVGLGLAAGLGAGCGDNEQPQGVIKSGSRLRASYFVDDDGDRMFRGWFDRDLAGECTWSGGDAPRCLPARIATHQFRDADCREPVVPWTRDPSDICAPRPAGYLAIARDACAADAVDELWTVGPEAVVLGTVHDLDARTGTCTARTVEPTSTFLHGAERVALDRFVGGQPRDLGHGRIRTRSIVSDDGAVVPGRAFDTELGATCEPTVERGCFPASAAATFAEDDACDHPVLTVPTACSPTPYLYMPQTTPVSLFERGELVTSDPARDLVLYNMSFIIAGQGWSCSRSNVRLLPGFSLYRAGPTVPLAASTLAWASR